MDCKIHWNILSLEEWEGLFASIPQSNVLQSYEYAIATCRVNRQSARWGLIKINNKNAGLVQIIEAKALWGLFHGIILDRGPLWFDGFGSAAHIAAFFEQFNLEFPNRLGRKKRIIPEIPHGVTADKIIQQNGFKPQTTPPYKTLWWNISLNSQILYEKTSNSWRKSLKKAQNSNLSIELDENLSYFDEFKAIYMLDRQNKSYENISPQLLDELASLSPKHKNMVIMKARIDKECIAAMLFLKHGQCATYQIGWTTDKGRQYCAHHLLLWEARMLYDRFNIHTLDLGGINDTQAGLTKFKTGTGAKEEILLGHYS